ncbi:MAG: glycerophosphodiester phosphodiesterase [Pirellulales bacterium]
MAILRCAAILWVVSAVGPSASGQLIIGHRGASHDAPENTLAAFQLALEQGADGFEADFYLLDDGHVVCFHDKDTERIAGKKLLLAQTPFDELRALDVGSWKAPRWRGERMPTLEEVLSAVPEGKKIFIELKSGPEIVAPMVKVIESSSLARDQMVVISFNADAIAESKKQLPHLKACWLCRFKQEKDGKIPPTADQVIATLKRIGADALDAEAVPEYFNEAFIRRLQEAGFSEFHVWTVDEPEIARVYRDLGAASITTNRPAWLREKLEKPESR